MTHFHTKMAAASQQRKANSTAKAFVAQVQTALRMSTRPTPTVHDIDCSRLWVQVRALYSLAHSARNEMRACG